jgi:hypothetical protein
MGGEDNGLTLEGLAQRLEDQTQRLEALERENAELRHEVAALRGSEDTHHHEEELAGLRGSGAPGAIEPASEKSDGRVSRKRLLSRAGAAAAGLLVAGALTQRDIREAKAAIVRGTTNTAYRGAVEGTNESLNGYGVWGNSRWIGVYGSGALYGVRGRSPKIGVHGIGDTGVYGQTSASGRAGVFGENIGTNGWGVVGEGKGGYPGVLGRNTDGTGAGVRGESSSGWAVFGQNTGSTGDGVHGHGRGPTNAGVSGLNYSGYGGTFFGGKAQLLLSSPPTSAIGRPTTGAHSFGELYLDPQGTLFVCTADGTPGTWRRFTTTAA